MRARNKSKKENRFTLTICYQDDGGRERWHKWRNVLVDNKASWSNTKKALLAYFPGLKHVNIYGGISKKFYKQIRVKDF